MDKERETRINSLRVIDRKKERERDRKREGEGEIERDRERERQRKRERGVREREKNRCAKIVCLPINVNTLYLLQVSMSFV